MLRRSSDSISLRFPIATRLHSIRTKTRERTDDWQPKRVAMSGKFLHEYDLELCAHLVSNIRAHRSVRGFAKFVEDELTDELAAFLFDDSANADSDDMLLNENDLYELEWVICEHYLSNKLGWEPYPQLYGRYAFSTREIRDELSPQAAQDWSKACVRFARKLRRPGATLSVGVQTISKWIGRLRQYLKAIGAQNLLPCPEGPIPTPTCREQRLVSVTKSSEGTRPDFKLAAAISRMRKVVQAHSKTAKAETLVRKAHISRQLGRNALRELEKTREYMGFARPRPQRFQDGRMNER